MRVSQNQGYHLGGPNNKDFSILGSPYLGNYHMRFDQICWSAAMNFNNGASKISNR